MKRFSRSLILSALAAIAAPAADGFRYGAQAGVLVPTSKSLKNVTDSKLGFSLGAQATWGLKEGQYLRGRFDYFALPRHTTEYRSSLPFTNVDDTVSGAAGTIEYLYFWEGKPAGLYLAGGLAVQSWSLESKTMGGAGGKVTKTKTGPGVAGGVGWQFTSNLAVEARGTLSKWDTLTSKDNLAATFGLEANWRF